MQVRSRSGSPGVARHRLSRSQTGGTRACRAAPHERAGAGTCGRAPVCPLQASRAGERARPTGQGPYRPGSSKGLPHQGEGSAKKGARKIIPVVALSIAVPLNGTFAGRFFRHPWWDLPDRPPQRGWITMRRRYSDGCGAWMTGGAGWRLRLSCLRSVSARRAQAPSCDAA